MFEMIGLLIATALLFAQAAVVSCLLTIATWAVLRGVKHKRGRLLLAAALLPILYAAYLWLCIALLPEESWFGDINQPLPNGYALTALGKMPDFASIDNPPFPYRRTGLSQNIGRIAISGPLVVGQYSHPLGAFEPTANEPFFVFDTRTSHTQEFPSQAGIEHQLGHSIALSDVANFRSMEPRAVSQRHLNKAIEFCPPIAAVCMLFVAALRARAKSHFAASNIYT